MAIKTLYYPRLLTSDVVNIDFSIHSDATIVFTKATPIRFLNREVPLPGDTILTWRIKIE